MSVWTLWPWLKVHPSRSVCLRQQCPSPSFQRVQWLPSPQCRRTVWSVRWHPRTLKSSHRDKDPWNKYIKPCELSFISMRANELEKSTSARNTRNTSCPRVANASNQVRASVFCSHVCLSPKWETARIENYQLEQRWSYKRYKIVVTTLRMRRTIPSRGSRDSFSRPLEPYQHSRFNERFLRLPFQWQLPSTREKSSHSTRRGIQYY